MKKLAIYILAGVAIATSAEDMDLLIAKSAKATKAQYSSPRFTSVSKLQKQADAGTVSRKQNLFSLITKHINTVYQRLNQENSLLVSHRRIKKEALYEPTKNYAKNIELLFEKTTSQIQITKKNFTVTDQSGQTYTVPKLIYDRSKGTIKALQGDLNVRLKLSDLSAADRLFVESGLADNLFKSNSRLNVEIVDQRSGGKKNASISQHTTSESSEERVSGAFIRRNTDSMSRRIIIENKGDFPIDNLILEYQNFIEQQVIKFQDDFPTDFRYVGHEIIPSIAPKATLEIEVPLPSIAEASLQSVEKDGSYYSLSIDSGLNEYSKGRINGIWIKLHRITPYGEHLEREIKGSGVPSSKWENVSSLSGL